MNNIVSVIVITYNSSATIIEALESVKCQTYREKIELIISDDCSTDDTVSVINHWLEKNKLFYSIIFLKNSVNLGITKNINSAVLNAKGKYIKFLSGDDKLSIQSSIAAYVEVSHGRKLILAPVNIIYDDVYDSKKSMEQLNKFSNFVKMSIRSQKMNVYASTSQALKITGMFIERDFLIDLGLFDERYIMMEDYPFMVKIFEQYYDKILFIKKQLYSYRQRHIVDDGFILSKRKREHTRSVNKFRKKVILPILFKNRYYTRFIATVVNMLLVNLESKNMHMYNIVLKLRKVYKISFFWKK